MGNFMDQIDAEEVSEISVTTIGRDEVPVTLFTTEFEEEGTHFCGDEDVQSYAQCTDNGTDECLLCAIGSTPENKLYFPVYNHDTSQVTILRISDNNKTFSLKRGLKNAMMEAASIGKDELYKRVLFIRRDVYRFSVRLGERVPEKVSTPMEVAIEMFQEGYKKGDLAEVANPRLTREYLLSAPGIRKKAELNGLVGPSMAHPGPWGLPPAPENFSTMDEIGKSMVHESPFNPKQEPEAAPVSKGAKSSKSAKGSKSEADSEKQYPDDFTL